MAKLRAKKLTEIERSTEELKGAKAAVLADLSKLNVADVTLLRRQARLENISVITAKKTLLRRALQTAGISGIDEAALKGGVTVLYGRGDEVTPAKVLEEFHKTHENITVLGGLLEKNWMSASQVQALAKLPSREQLIASVVGTIRAPLSGLVGVLSGNLRNIVQVLNAVKDAKSA